jgi:hypothetical protein
MGRQGEVARRKAFKPTMGKDKKAKEGTIQTGPAREAVVFHYSFSTAVADGNFI